MTGHIIFEPPTPTQVWSGAQYNEPFSAWKVAADQPGGGTR